MASQFTKKTPRNIRRVLGTVVLGYNERLNREHAGTKPRMAVFAHDQIGTHINQFGFYDLERMSIAFDWLGSVLKEPDRRLALDIGANIGNHSLYMLKYFRELHSFEPSSSSFALLCFNLQEFKQAVTHNIALGESNETMSIVQSPENSGDARLVPLSSERRPGEEVIVRRLDDLEIDLRGLSVVKIDVEGNECKVLRGAIKTITRYQPAIILEQKVGEFVEGESPSITLLKSLGYNFFWIRNKIPARGLPMKFLRSVVEMFRGRELEIVGGDVLPADNYPMIIAIPRRLLSSIRSHA